MTGLSEFLGDVESDIQKFVGIVRIRFFAGSQRLVEQRLTAQGAGCLNKHLRLLRNRDVQFDGNRPRFSAEILRFLEVSQVRESHHLPGVNFAEAGFVNRPKGLNAIENLDRGLGVAGVVVKGGEKNVSVRNAGTEEFIVCIHKNLNIFLNGGDRFLNRDCS